MPSTTTTTEEELNWDLQLILVEGCGQENVDEKCVASN